MSNLTIENVNEIAGALHRLDELGQAKIVTNENEAEKRGLEQFVAVKLRIHATELLGNWMVIKGEYEPLLNGFVGLLSRATASIAQAQQAQKAAAEKAPQ